tara:strand:+ start:182 stop:619 length:438 start_codon:yes stop_codon:yes gene_type:complete
MKTKINILWASMSGTAENVAQQLEKKAIEADFDVNISELNDVSMNDLSEMKNVAIITSTTGVGDLPTNGDDFWLDLEKCSKDFSNLNYSVCALGDRSHEIFCGAGNKVNKKLMELGAKQIIEIQECDGSDEGSDEWGNEFLRKVA